MSRVSGFGSNDVRWRVPPENPHEGGGEGFTFRSIGESMRSLREERRSCRNIWTPGSDRRGIFHTFRSPGGGWLAWQLINFGFKTLRQREIRWRQRERQRKCFQLLQPLPLPPAAIQVALRRSWNDRYFEPLLIPPSSENSGGGVGVVVRARERTLWRAARSCLRVFSLTTF